MPMFTEMTHENIHSIFLCTQYLMPGIEIIAVDPNCYYTSEDEEIDVESSPCEISKCEIKDSF